MAEIYKNTNTAVSTKLYINGDAVQPEGDVVVYFSDITEDPKVSPAIDPEDVILTLTATESDVDFSVYSVIVPVTYANRNRKYKLQWVYEYNSTTYYHYTYLDVVTPYISIEEALEDLGVGSDANDPNYKSYHELRMAEKYARKQVEHFTGQKFYLHDNKFTIMGNDSSVLPLPSKIYQLHTLHQNDNILIDNLNNINNIGYIIEPTASGFGIKINQSSLIEGDTYIANGMVPPSIHDVSPNIFKANKSYDVYARFGWHSVPDDVEQATIEIMRSYFSKDRAWRDKYVNKISTTDWDFEFKSEAFNGTGSSYADKLLLDYVITQMVVV